MLVDSFTMVREVWICFVVAVVLNDSNLLLLLLLPDFDLSFLDRSVPLGGSGWLECVLWSYVKMRMLV